MATGKMFVNSSTNLSKLSSDLRFDLMQHHFAPAVFQAALRTNTMGRYLSYLPGTTSTMEIAKIEAMRGCIHGTLIMAEQQSHGRGRGEGRIWQSQPKGNLYFTFVLRPMQPALLALLNLGISVAVAKAIQEVTKLEARIKWPNDIWIRGRKCCGMLLDVEVQNEKYVVAAGVGINVNEDMTKNPDEVVRSTATSLFNESGRQVSREVLLAAICNHYEELIAKFDSVESMLPEFLQYDILVGHNIVVMPKRREDTASYYTAFCLGYTKDGFIRVRMSNGEERVLVSEEVSIRPENLS